MRWLPIFVTSARLRVAAAAIILCLGRACDAAVAEVFGADDRIAVPSNLALPARGIGLLTNDKSKVVCTMFCVASDIAATAAHCLDASGPAGATHLSHVRLSVPPHREADTTTIAGRGTSNTAQHVTTGQFTSSPASLAPVAAHDWALVKLERPVCNGRVLMLDRSEATTPERRVSHIAFHSDRGLAAPGAVVDCRLWRASEANSLALHDCDTGGASSGSPILFADSTDSRVVAMNVGVYRTSRVVVRATSMAAPNEATAVANAAIDVTSIAARLDAFAGAIILTDVEQLKRLQRALGAGGWFRSAINGVYSAAMGAAIARYEAATGRPVTGLATQALLTALDDKPQ